MIKIEPNKADDFINDDELQGYLDNAVATKDQIREIIAKGKNKERLTMEESAILITRKDPYIW